MLLCRDLYRSETDSGERKKNLTKHFLIYRMITSINLCLHMFMLILRHWKFRWLSIKHSSGFPAKSVYKLNIELPINYKWSTLCDIWFGGYCFLALSANANNIFWRNRLRQKQCALNIPRIINNFDASSNDDSNWLTMLLVMKFDSICRFYSSSAACQHHFVILDACLRAFTNSTYSTIFFSLLVSFVSLSFSALLVPRMV